LLFRLASSFLNFFLQYNYLDTNFWKEKKMNRRRFITSITAAVIVFTVVLSTSLQAEVRYNVIALQGSSSFSINNNGQIVGYSSGMGGPCATLFDWTGQGNNIILDPSHMFMYSIAISINNNGQIVGIANGQAFLFDSTGNGNNVNLGGLEAWSISDNGQIVGYSGNHATLFDPTGNGNNIDLGTLGGTDSTAYSINNNGLIVGGAQDSSGHWRACLFDPTGHGNNIDLKGGDGEACAINNNGQIVGHSGNHATLFDPTGNGNNIDLGPGCAYSINNNGQIIGTDNNGTPILFDPTGHGDNIDLNTLIDPNTGWTFCGGPWGVGTPINDNGWIVGQGSKGTSSGACVLIPLPGPPMLPLTIDVRPAGLGINTVIPFPGTTQHTQYTNVMLSARNFPVCPTVYLFDHWEGEGIADINAPYTHVLMDEPKTVTAVFVLGERRCGDECHPILQGDLNEDCYVNFEDFAIYVTQWLSCTHPDCD
jgi:uncharacterized membrane protein